MSSSNTNTPTFLQDISYLDFLFTIVLGWILVVLWQRTLDNFTFQTLALNDKSVYHTFVIALVATIIFLTFVFTFNDMLNNIVGNDRNSPLEPPAPPKTAGNVSIDANGNIHIS